MNEIELIRGQLVSERARVVAVAGACARALARAATAAPGGEAALRAFAGACTEYLRAVLEAFAERDRRVAALCTRLPGGSRERRALEELLAAPGTSAAALAQLATVSDAPRRAWTELADYVSGAWNTRREAIEALLGANHRVSDWRTVGALDAEAILAERARFAQLRSLLPAGIELTPLAPLGAPPQERAR
ncbi:MAG TPA: hypothetical protein VEU54_04090 [Steroidobacteraceae bacterium]|nr:hypothetical protein [Steroidobacteraceae bacterium]